MSTARAEKNAAEGESFPGGGMSVLGPDIGAWPLALSEPKFWPGRC